ncbi:MAG: hypothetical protein JW724_04745 [Candidatus Altiarchaeota archaeon]|nr:hypothetical protein [Candidatus Altiarchaeota archaeon]
MKNKNKVLASVLVFALVIVSALTLFAIFSGKGMLYESASALVLALIVLFFAVLYLKGGLADARRGMPFQDERTKNILLHAGSKAFTLSIWWLLALMYFADKMDIIPRHVAAAGILGMALLFFTSWLWYDRRGVPE